VASRRTVAFLANGSRRIPSARARVYQLVPHLQAAGIETTALDPSRLPRRLGGRTSLYRLHALRAVRATTVGVIQKRMFDRPTMWALQAANSRLVYDFDDALYSRPAAEPHLRRMLRAVRHVTAGNAHLAGYAQCYAREVTVIPTVVDTAEYSPAPPRGTDDRPVTIGWAGTSANLSSLEAVRPALQEVVKRSQDRVVIRILSDEAPSWPELPVVYEEWTYERRIAAIREFDIGLMPLSDTEWTRGKCGFKAIEYMALGIPPVVSPVGVLTEIVDHGRTGFVAGGARDWADALSRLVGDPPLRTVLGRAGRDVIERSYSVNAVVPRLVDLFEQLGLRQA
jgi:glycosyltransferase involved in cell wall biosynthesis